MDGQPFVVRTDHASLKWLEYDFRNDHWAVISHRNADALSRRQCTANSKHCPKPEKSYLEIRTYTDPCWPRNTQARPTGLQRYWTNHELEDKWNEAYVEGDFSSVHCDKRLLGNLVFDYIWWRRICKDNMKVVTGIFSIYKLFFQGRRFHEYSKIFIMEQVFASDESIKPCSRSEDVTTASPLKIQT